MSAASDQITEYLSVGGLFNPEMMNQTQHEAVRDTLIKARDDIQRLESENAALRAERVLVSVRTGKFTTISGRAMICPDCGRALLHEDRAVIDAARNKSPSWGDDQIMGQHLNNGGTPT